MFFRQEPLSDCLQKTVWYNSKRIQAQAVINRPAPDDVTMIGFDDLPIADSLYVMIIPGLSEPPVRTLRAIYSGNSEPPYWALLHIFPLYCKDTPLV